MVGFGGAMAFRDWLRSWTERLDRLDAHVRKLVAEERDSTHPAGQNPDDSRQRHY